MTCTEKLSRASRWRIRTGAFSSTEVDGWNGHFLVPLEGELWHVIISDQCEWRHLSVTNAQKKMLPSWNIMCRLKDAFFGDEDWVCQYHPAKDDNINDHPFCLHLWQPLNEQLPTPPYVFV
ncbi:MAG TPA: hypothetical protein VFP71_03050 [Candidatus Angelobacter sp.]|nr:hypothetical protein [Candidatus Angelobacter sp.]